jgi:hypothetical protein
MEANRKRKYNSAKKAAIQTVVKAQTRTAAWLTRQVQIYLIVESFYICWDILWQYVERTCSAELVRASKLG